MSHLRPGDEAYHLPDGSHRWFRPAGEGCTDREWEDRVAGHVDLHRENPDGGTMPWRPVPPPPE